MSDPASTQPSLHLSWHVCTLRLNPEGPFLSALTDWLTWCEGSTRRPAPRAAGCETGGRWWTSRRRPPRCTRPQIGSTRPETNDRIVCWEHLGNKLRTTSYERACICALCLLRGIICEHATLGSIHGVEGGGGGTNRNRTRILETGYNVALCPRGNWLCIQTNLIWATQILPLRGLVGLWCLLPILFYKRQLYILFPVYVARHYFISLTHLKVSENSIVLGNRS